MKTIEDVTAAWQEDCKIAGKLDEVSRNTPALHAKYLHVLTNTKMKLKMAEQAQHRLLKQKFLYYNGKLSQEELKQTGWDPDPFNGLKILKGEMEYYYESDPEIQESELKITYYKNMIDVLKEIIDNLKWRHQTIRNIIEWKKFEYGD